MSFVCRRFAAGCSRHPGGALARLSRLPCAPHALETSRRAAAGPMGGRGRAARSKLLILRPSTPPRLRPRRGAARPHVLAHVRRLYARCAAGRRAHRPLELRAARRAAAAAAHLRWLPMPVLRLRAARTAQRVHVGRGRRAWRFAVTDREPNQSKVQTWWYRLSLARQHWAVS